MEISPELIKGQVMNCYNSLILDVRLADNSLVPVFAVLRKRPNSAPPAWTP